MATAKHCDAMSFTTAEALDRLFPGAASPKKRGDHVVVAQTYVSAFVHERDDAQPRRPVVE